MGIDYKETGFRFIDENTIEFWCEENLYKGIESDDSVYVTGSFNSWLNSGDSAWKLEKKVSRNNVYYTLQKPASMVMIGRSVIFRRFERKSPAKNTAFTTTSSS